MMISKIQWHRKLFKSGWGYLSYQDTFVWRKITFLWSDSKKWGGGGAPAPFSATDVLNPDTIILYIM